MSLARDSVETALTVKMGMTRLPDRDAHRFYRLTVDGKNIAQTFVSHGTKYRTLGDDLVKKMARQMHTTTPKFRELVSCTLSKDQYLEELRLQGDL